MNPNHDAPSTEAPRIESEKLSLTSLLSRISQAKVFDSLLRILQTPTRKLTVSGLHGSLSSFVIAEIFNRESTPMLLVCNDEDIERYENDLPILLGKKTLIDFTAEPALALSALLSDEKKLILSTPAELCRKVLPKTLSQTRKLTLKQGETIGYTRLEEFLVQNGFTRKDFIEEEGDYAIRGSIVDVFSFDAIDPVRIEFFGDEVDSIRTVDIASQLSKEKLSETELVANLAQSASESESLLDYLRPESLVITDNTADYGADVESPDFFKKDEITRKLEAFRQVEIQKIGKGEIDFARARNKNSTPIFQNLEKPFGAMWRVD
jgi:transcription-repair coupling factor (superfamily II helicase)